MSGILWAFFGVFASASGALAQRNGTEGCWAKDANGHCWAHAPWVQVVRRQGFTSFVEKKREALGAWLRPRDSTGVFRGLFLTEKTEDRREEMFRTLGFVHLIRSSGIHFYAAYDAVRGACVGSAHLLAWMGWRIRPPWLLFFSRSAGLALIFWGWLMSGARPGLLRPLCVMALRSAARRVGFAWRWWSPLVVALLIDGAVSWALGGSGWGRFHYALAVGGGLSALEKTQDKPKWVQHGAMAIGSWLAASILDVWECHWIQFSIPLLSLITIPLFGVLAFPLGLIASIMDQQALWTFFGAVISGLNVLLRGMTEVLIDVPQHWLCRPPVFLAAAMGVWLWMMFRKTGRLRLWMVIAGVGIFRGGLDMMFASGRSVRVIQLNVGQGDAAWVELGGVKRMKGFIDVGPARAKSWDQWFRFLAREFAGSIDFIALTHGDEDHRGALLKISTLARVRCLAVHPALVRPRVPFAPRTLNVRSVGQGCEPFEAWVLPSIGSGGNRTMVGYRVGFYANAGDAGVIQERWFLKELEKNRSLNHIAVWKISHHGSRFSTPTIERLGLGLGFRPRELWISVGRYNHYGHPHPEAIDRMLRWQPARILRTDRDGDISYSNSKY